MLAPPMAPELLIKGMANSLTDEMPRIGHRIEPLIDAMIDALAEISCLLERRDANAFSVLASVTDQVLGGEFAK